MKQAEKIYMISDAAKQVEVEAHVLRYWEEELEVPAKRNEMGHRYYTEEDIRRFIRIKELKEQGLQLKAIRHMLKNGDLQTPVLLFDKPEGQQGAEMAGLSQSELDMGKRHVVMVKKGEFLPVEEKTMALQEETREQKSYRLQQLLKDMIAEAVQCNTEEICQDIKETLLKELDYQFRLREEREEAREEERAARQEEHYQQIDELIRSYARRGKRGKRVRKDAAARRENAQKEALQKKENRMRKEAEKETEEEEARIEETGIGIEEPEMEETIGQVNEEINEAADEEMVKENLAGEETAKEDGPKEEENQEEMAGEAEEQEENGKEKAKSKGFFPRLFLGKKRSVL